MATCTKRVGRGTITYPCVVEVPPGRTEHDGPCAAVENQQSMLARQRYDAPDAVAARATMAAHQSQPLTFAQAHGSPDHPPTPVPGSGLQPAEHRQVHRPVMGEFGAEPIPEPPCQHPFGSIYTAADGATICAVCNERLKEPEEPTMPEPSLRAFVEEHQAPPEVLAARAEENAATMRAATPPISAAEVREAQEQMGAALGQAIHAAVTPPTIEGAEPFPGLQAAPPRSPLSIPRLGIQEQPAQAAPVRYPEELPVGTEIQFHMDGLKRGRIVPIEPGWQIPEGFYAVQMDDLSVWAVSPSAITAVYGEATPPSDPEPYNGGFMGPALQAPVERAEPTKQRPGDQQLPNEGNPRPSVQSVIIAMAQASEEVGIERYGQALKPLNGRDTFQDLVDEARDFFVYGTCLMMERDEILQRFERAYSAVFNLPHQGQESWDALMADLDAVLAWLRGAPQT